MKLTLKTDIVHHLGDRCLISKPVTNNTYTMLLPKKSFAKSGRSHSNLGYQRLRLLGFVGHLAKR